jgi:dTDP-glucose pyrophosphorylase
VNVSERLRECQVRADASLLDAMRSLEASNVQIVLVVDRGGRLVGTVTDGDIRRAILQGSPLDAPVGRFANPRFVSVGSDQGRASVLELMHARRVNQIPVVDERERVVGLHLLQEMLGVRERPSWALIMAGGRGTRLLPLTENVPKPMLPVAGKPILERIVLHLIGHGIHRIFISVQHLSHVIEDHFGDGRRLGCRIEYLREERPLGTAGALSLLPEPPVEPLLVMNGDLVTQADVGALLDFQAMGPQVATMAIRRYLHTVPFGCVELEGDRVVGLEEKPTLARMVNAGIYALAPALVRRVDAGRETTMPELLAAAMARGELVRTFEVSGDWIDVGQRDQLRQARGEP